MEHERAEVVELEGAVATRAVPATSATGASTGSSSSTTAPSRSASTLESGMRVVPILRGELERHVAEREPAADRRRHLPHLGDGVGRRVTGVLCAVGVVRVFDGATPGPAALPTWPSAAATRALMMPATTITSRTSAPSRRSGMTMASGSGADGAGDHGVALGEHGLRRGGAVRQADERREGADRMVGHGGGGSRTASATWSPQRRVGAGAASASPSPAAPISGSAIPFGGTVGVARGRLLWLSLGFGLGRRLTASSLSPERRRHPRRPRRAGPGRRCRR